MGIFAGVRAFFGGVSFVVRTPAVWLFASVPVLSAALFFAGLATLAVLGVLVVSDQAFGSASGLAWGLRIVLRAALVLVALLVSALVALALAQPLSGWALDRIVRAQERALGLPEHAPHRAFAQLARAVGVNLVGLAAGLPILGLLAAISFVFPVAAVVCVPLKLAVCALLAAWDLLDYPLSLRAMPIGARVAWMRARFGAVFTFGLCAAIVLLVPGVGLFVLPMGVAGAARLAGDEPHAPPREGACGGAGRRRTPTSGRA